MREFLGWFVVQVDQAMNTPWSMLTMTQGCFVILLASVSGVAGWYLAMGLCWPVRVIGRWIANRRMRGLLDATPRRSDSG